MSSYRKRSQAKPTTAAGLRAQASANGSSIFGNRSRSISGLFPLNQNSYSGFLGINGTPVGLPNFLNKTSKSSESFRKSPYSNSTSSLNYQNPYTTYGGTASGYGSITLPININSLRLPSSMSYNYLNLSTNKPSQFQRTESFKKSKTKPDVQIGSRSSSLQSLASSEGYISGNDRSGRSNRLGSISSFSSETPPVSVRIKSSTSENGELDYKKLYEESQAENERLKEKLRRSDEQLKDARNLLDKAQSAQNKTVLSEAEKRERRAMERKLSEMEEELKVMDQLKCENQRLKDENGALIRVISKLSK